MRDLHTKVRDLVASQKASAAAADARSRLPPGSSRARVTTANARWARAAEHRDRCAKAVHDEIAAMEDAELIEQTNRAEAKLALARQVFGFDPTSGSNIAKLAVALAVRDALIREVATRAALVTIPSSGLCGHWIESADG